MFKNIEDENMSKIQRKMEGFLKDPNLTYKAYHV